MIVTVVGRGQLNNSGMLFLCYIVQKHLHAHIPLVSLLTTQFHRILIMSAIPTIDMRNIDAKALLEIDMACRDHGFFKLIGHGLNDLIDQMWEQTSIFFASPRELKVSVMRTEENAFGYYDRELTKQMRDQKETFDFPCVASYHKITIGNNREALPF